MYQTIEINGELYPVSFGMMALGKFAQKAGLTLKQIAEIDKYLDLHNTFVLAYCGIQDGFRKAKKAGDKTGLFTLEFEDFVDLLDDDREALGRIMEAFSEAMPEAETGNGKAQISKKKVTARKLKSVGAN